GASASYSCAAGPSGIHCWGTRNTDYRDERPIERHVLVLDATGLGVDDDFGCVTNSARELVCWGRRFDVEEGIVAAAKPTVFARDMDPIVALAGPCVLERDGDLRCDLFGRSITDLPVGNRAGVTDVAFGMSDACVLAGGRVECLDPRSPHSWSAVRGFRS